MGIKRFFEQTIQSIDTQVFTRLLSLLTLNQLQEKQRAAVQRSLGRSSMNNLNGKARAQDGHENVDEDGYFRDSNERGGYVHPDLEDLNFGALGSEQRCVFSISFPFSFFIGELIILFLLYHDVQKPPATDASFRYAEHRRNLAPWLPF